MQNRIVKNIVNASTGVSEKTYYIRDAQGNIMAIYELKNGELRWSEQELYGSGRVGTYETNSVAYPVPVDPNSPTGNGLSILLPSGARRYELSNHLGNVLCVLSDVKRPVLEGSTTFFETDRLSTNDYYPFGMLMPGRKSSLDVYRFGFNGKENDNEAKGEGNQQDYGMRIYDPRVGRFLSVDPLAGKYAGVSTYHAFANNPLLFIDPDGGKNMIYFVFLDDGNSHLDNMDKARIVRNARTILKRNFGLFGFSGFGKSKVGVIGINSNKPFSNESLKKLDKSDRIVYFGNTETISDALEGTSLKAEPGITDLYHDIGNEKYVPISYVNYDYYFENKTSSSKVRPIPNSKLVKRYKFLYKDKFDSDRTFNDAFLNLAVGGVHEWGHSMFGIGGHTTDTYNGRYNTAPVPIIVKDENREFIENIMMNGHYFEDYYFPKEEHPNLLKFLREDIRDIRQNLDKGTSYDHFLERLNIY